jgi:hypothetical protein
MPCRGPGLRGEARWKRAREAGKHAADVFGDFAGKGRLAAAVTDHGGDVFDQDGLAVDMKDFACDLLVRFGISTNVTPVHSYLLLV